MVHEPEERYDGPAAIAGTEVDVLLRGHFEPIDGRFHWWGRIAPNARIDSEQSSGNTVTLVTPHGEASGPTLRRRPVGSFPDQRDGPTTVLSGRSATQVDPHEPRRPATAVAVAGHRRRGS